MATHPHGLRARPTPNRCGSRRCTGALTRGTVFYPVRQARSARGKVATERVDHDLPGAVSLTAVPGSPRARTATRASGKRRKSDRALSIVHSFVSDIHSIKIE